MLLQAQRMWKGGGCDREPNELHVEACESQHQVKPEL